MGSADQACAGLMCVCEHVRRARCGNTARRDLWRGGRVTGRSTLTCAETSSDTSYRVSLQKGSNESTANKSLSGKANQPPVSSLGYIEESRTVHPAGVKAQLKGNATGATSACPVYGYNRRTECTKRRQRTMRAVRATARPKANQPRERVT